MLTTSRGPARLPWYVGLDRLGGSAFQGRADPGQQGFNLRVSPTYALTAEHFPTRARTTGFAIVDGVGHIGGGIGILVLAPLIP